MSLFRRASAVDCGHQSPRAYRQNIQRNNAAGTKAHGTLGMCLTFSPASNPHGTVPTVAIRPPLIIARTMTGSRAQNLNALRPSVLR